MPVDRDAGGRGDRDQVDRVIGRAAGREQPDDRVDHRALVDDAPSGRYRRPAAVIAAARLRRRLREGLAQRRAWIDESAAGQVQAHHLHQHLVAVGRAVERTGAGARDRTRPRPGAVRRDRPFPRRTAGECATFSAFGNPEGIGPAGTNSTGRCPNVSAPISSPGTILSQTPRHSAASNMSWTARWPSTSL